MAGLRARGLGVVPGFFQQGLAAADSAARGD